MVWVLDKRYTSVLQFIHVQRTDDVQGVANMTPLAQQIQDIERQIALIEHTAANYIGGDKAYHSGHQTFLKPAAQRKVDSLNKKLDALLDSVEA
jgi:antirestriction protein ArdC